MVGRIGKEMYAETILCARKQVGTFLTTGNCFDSGSNVLGRLLDLAYNADENWRCKGLKFFQSAL